MDVNVIVARAERMQQRMRGAGHGQIEDVSFQLNFDENPTSEIDPQTSPERPAPRTTPTPNTSAKRRKLDSDSARPGLHAAADDTRQASRQSPGKPDPYELEEGSSTESALHTRAQPTRSTDAATEEHGRNSVESLPPTRPVSHVSPASRRVTADNTEVEESPVDAPGSGRRRTISTSSAVASSARLQQVLSPTGENETETVPISSPLERKVRRNTASTRRSTLSSRGSRNSGASNEGLDELSPDRTANSVAGGQSPELSYRHDVGREEAQTQSAEEEPGPEPGPGSPADLEAAPETIVEDEEGQERDDDVSLAEEVDANEAAQRLGQKRPRRSPRGPTAEPDSTVIEDSQEDPLPKRRRKQPQKSPAKQKQGRRKTTSKAKSSPAKAAPKGRKKRGSDGIEGDKMLSIAVQRFTRRAPLVEGGDDDADVLNLDIPFASRSGVNTVDVLAQVCDEILDASLGTLKEGIRTAEDASTKKEYRVKLRALEAYQEELRNRFLQHTIFIDTLHSLRKRVRSVQKDRIALRDDIMRIRGEREQVALRKDAIRAKHEKATEETMATNPSPPQNQLSLSSQMHDIDLAVERGRAAPELTPAENKKAELANLEILISRITDQACTQSDTGGALRQIKDFNAFLERAALALESRQ
ncbi:hypothetical protein CCHL11_06952 [Colletotrichum chlorophyti]|uniref:Inner kinetochore subunit AME1 domain-containing protein n=1 Tax=Colletotrichum chlorophyti TaxID=708187 RepID=A0A1Q8RBH2_9PEZI|nr:hypothetical protein CCHL11_06952 [Colletotrichum chlorophyti]